MSRTIKLSPVQRKLLQALSGGAILWYFRDRDEYELSGRPFWPRQKSTILRLLGDGLIAEDHRENTTQHMAHMRTIGLTNKGRRLLEEGDGA